MQGLWNLFNSMPTGALQQNHFKNEQLLAQVKSAFTFEGE
jgi:heterodisulfide reductase subunit A